jgi:phage terminase small subunit
MPRPASTIPQALRRGPKPRTPSAAPSGPSYDLWEGFQADPTMSPAVAAEFNRLKSSCRHFGTLHATDPAILEMAAHTIDLLNRAHAQVKADGLVLTNAKGVRCAHPLLAVIANLVGTQRALWKTMGLTGKRGNLLGV